MKTLSLLAAVLALGLTLGSADAEAKRLGGGRSSGMQRESVTQTAPAHTPTAPAVAPAPAYKPAAATPPAAAQPKRSWMGPLAGLAAGLGLAALASHFGFGGELASALMIGLLAMVAVAVIGMIMRRRTAAQQPVATGLGGMQYAGAGAPMPETPVRASYETVPPVGGSAIGAGLGGGAATGSAIGAGLNAAPAIPAGFDVEAFVRSAKVNFIRLQAANDAGRADDIREFTTPEMFAELQMDMLERGGAVQQTEVVSLDAQVLEVVEDGARYIASVRYSGLVREQKGAAAEPFDEVWHLSKPRAGEGGWILSGIQQVPRH